MTSLNAQLRAAQRVFESAPDDEDEWVGERTDDLVRERMADEKIVRDVIDNALGNDYDGVFARMLTTFFRRFDDAETDERMADAGNALFHDLRQMVEPEIRAEAETDATLEFNKLLADEAEARDDYREMSRGNY